MLPRCSEIEECLGVYFAHRFNLLTNSLEVRFRHCNVWEVFENGIL